MTLADLADYICTKMEQTDDDSVAACKKFLNARYRMIWDSQLWRDTLFAFSGLYPPFGSNATGLPGTQFLITQSQVERVLKVVDYTDDPNFSLSPMDLGLVFDANLSGLAGGAAPRNFVCLPPSVALVDAAPVGVSSASPDDAALSVAIAGMNTAGEYVREQIQVGDATTNYFSEIQAVGKPVSTGVFTVSYDGPSFALAPYETSAPVYPRIALLDNSTTADFLRLYLLCKRRCPGLVFDADAPTLLNVDNALIDLAHADMLERNRQYGKSQAKLQSAAGQMQILYDLERNQTASETRIVPVDIHGDYGTGGGGRW